MSRPAIDMTGKAFGKWTVLARSGSRPIGTGMAAAWLCQCECGERRVLLGTDLRRGKTTSCGCENRRIGERFSRWTVVAYPSGERKGAKGKSGSWVCRCECGTVREVRTDRLTSGESRSCGCLMVEVNAERMRATTGELHPGWKGDGVGYSMAHRRIARERGSASAKSCSDCHQPAMWWCYVGAPCPNERWEVLYGWGTPVEVPYCPTPDEHADCYVTLCAACATSRRVA